MTNKELNDQTVNAICSTSAFQDLEASLERSKELLKDLKNKEEKQGEHAAHPFKEDVA